MRLVLVALLLCGCGLRSRDDGGTPGAGGGNGQGGGAGGGGGGGGGGAAGGAGRALTWASMSPGLSANFYAGISGVGSGASVVLYVGQWSSRIARYQNNAWATVYVDPQNVNYKSVWVSANEEVFATGNGDIARCLSNCTQQSSWSKFSAPPNGFDGLCGTDLEHLYVVGNLSNHGTLHRYQPDAGVWRQVSADTGSVANAACWVAPDLTVYIAAQSKILAYDGAAFTPEAIAFPTQWTSTDIALQYFTSIAGSGSEVYAAGSGKRVVWRSGPGQWTFAFNPNDDRDFNAIATGGNGAVAGGTYLGQGEVLATGLQQSWAWDPALPGMDVLGIWAATPDEYYLVGGQSLTGLVYRGRR